MIRKVLAHILYAVFFLISLPPYFFINLLSHFFVFLNFYFIKYRKEVVLDNLKRCFPEKSKIEIKNLAKNSFRHFFLNIFEFGYIPRITEKTLKKRISIYGIENLDTALEKNKGVCIFSAHIGNFEYSAAALCSKGYDLSVISKEISVKPLQDFVFKVRSKFGLKYIPARGVKSIFATLRALKNNGIVVFAMDQHSPSDFGLKTKFFGQDVQTSSSLGIIAKRSQAAIIPSFSVRRKSGYYDLYILKELEISKNLKDENSMVGLAQEVNDIIEKYIRINPDQWMWTHRRWKSKDGKVIKRKI